MAAPTHRELFTGLLRELRAAGPLGRLRLLGRGVGALRQLSPWDRKMLLRMAGFEGAEDLIERLAAGDPATADRLQRIVAEVERDPDRAQEAVRALADPHRRGEAIDSLIRTLDRTVEAEQPEVAGEPEGAEEPETAAKTPPTATRPPAPGEKPFPELEVGKARPSDAARTAARTAGGAATAAAAGAAAARAAGTRASNLPEPAPEPPKAGPRPSPPPAEPRMPGPPARAEIPPVPSAQKTREAPAPVPPPRPEPAPAPPAAAAAPEPPPSPEPPELTGADLVPALAELPSGPLVEHSGHDVLTGLLGLRRRLERGEEVTAEALRRLLGEEITPPWARRRAVSAWIEASRPGKRVDLDEALALVAELEKPGDRTWCLASLATSRPWPRAAWRKVLEAAPDDAARRRIERRRAA